MTCRATSTVEKSARPSASPRIRIVVAAMLLAAAAAAVLRFEPSRGVPAAINGSRPTAGERPFAAVASATSRGRAAPASDDEARQLVIGAWEDDYQGNRTLTVRPDGTATMVIEFDGWKATMFTPRLQIETTWTIDAGRFNRRTIGGEPADKVEFVKGRVGDRASDRIVKVTADRMLLIDQDGETRYDWRRVR